MSSRVFKKVLTTKPIKSNVEDTNESDEEEAPRVVNTFALLGEEDEGLQNEEDEEEVVEKPQITTTTTTTTSSKKSKKKKKKSKSKPQDEQNEEEEDIDALINQFKQEVDIRQNTQDNQKPSIFKLDTRYLNSQYELIRIFGKKIINQESKQKGGRPLLNKKTMLVKPKEHWGKTTGSISMELEDSKNGVNYFRIKWSQNYKELQKQFFVCVQSGDPNTFGMILQQDPYHVDTLLQLAEFYKLRGELDTVMDLIERCIFCFECSWHHLFNPTNGKCRLEYKIEENRTFFLAMFRYCQILSRKGMNRSALEYSKLLLGLDPSDPLGVLYLIDSFCLRSDQFQYLLDLSVAVDELPKTVSLLPNFAYSIALAKFHLESRNPDSEKKEPNADSLIQSALMLFPMWLKPMAKKAKLTLNETNSGYTTDLSSHGFFTSPKFTNAVIDNLVTLYVERNYQLWQPQEVQKWLKKNILITVKRAEEGDPLVDSFSAALHEEYSGQSENLYNHVMLSEYADSTVGVLPADALDDVRMGRAGPQLYDAFHEAQPVVHAQYSNPLALFLGTLFNPVVPNAPALPQDPNQQDSILDRLYAFLTNEANQHGEHED